jgi:hypothetical protein
MDRRGVVGAFLAAVLAGVALAPLAPAAEAVPVQFGGEADYDACAGIAIVTGVDPGSVLNVRAGPGLGFRVTARLRPDAQVILCDERDGWEGIVFALDRRDCGTGETVVPRRAYAGPCRTGWVHSSYLRLTAD